MTSTKQNKTKQNKTKQNKTKQTTKKTQINGKIVIQKKTARLRQSAKVHTHSKQQQKYHQKFIYYSESILRYWVKMGGSIWKIKCVSWLYSNRV